MEVSWGLVTSTVPVQVRFVGDSADTPVGLQAAGLTLDEGDKVMLAKLGATSGWCVVCVLEVP